MLCIFANYGNSIREAAVEQAPLGHDGAAEECSGKVGVARSRDECQELAEFLAGLRCFEPNTCHRT